MHDKSWDKNAIDMAVKHGPHQSVQLHNEILSQEIIEMINVAK